MELSPSEASRRTDNSGISQHFMEFERSLPRSQDPSIGPYKESDEFVPYHPVLFLENLFLYCPTYVYVFLVVSFFLISHQTPIRQSPYRLFCPLRATYVAQLIHLDSTILIIFHEEYKLMKLLSMQFSPFLLISSHLRLSILLSNLHSMFFAYVRDQVSQPVVLYVLIFTFLNSRREDERFWTE
jgi:hypothetical protein